MQFSEFLCSHLNDQISNASMKSCGRKLCNVLKYFQYWLFYFVFSEDSAVLSASGCVFPRFIFLLQAVVFLTKPHLLFFFWSHRMHWKRLFHHYLPAVAHRRQWNCSCVHIWQINKLQDEMQKRYPNLTERFFVFASHLQFHKHLFNFQGHFCSTNFWSGST